MISGRRIGSSLLLASAIWLPSLGALACHDGNDMRTVDHDLIKLRVAVNGVREYEFAATCSAATERDHPEHNHLVFSSTSTWDPATRQASEQVIGNAGWQVRNLWSCPVDPWAQYSGVNCRLLDTSANGTPPPITRANRPFSSIQTPVDVLAKLLKKSMPPPPALPPRNPTAAVFQQRARLSWQPPADHTSIHPTVAWFRVERRPVEPASAAWFAASGNLPATRTVYDDPDPLPTPTEYRVCAINVSGIKCSGVVAARSAALSPAQPSMRSSMTRQMTLDERVRSHLLGAFPASATAITVHSNADGVVTLSGMVRTPREKQGIVQSTRGLPGVRDVQDRIGIITERAGAASAETTLIRPATTATPAEKPGNQQREAISR